MSLLTSVFVLLTVCAAVSYTFVTYRTLPAGGFEDGLTFPVPFESQLDVEENGRSDARGLSYPNEVRQRRKDHRVSPG